MESNNWCFLRHFANYRSFAAEGNRLVAEKIYYEGVTAVGGIIERIGPWLMSADPIYIYLAVALYALIEVIFPPFPGDALVIFAGALAGRRGLPVTGIIIAGVLGTVAASTVAYMVGRFGRNFLAGHVLWRKYVPPERLRRAEGWFSRYGAWTLLISRFLPGIRTPLVVAAGLARLTPMLTLGLVSISITANVTVMVLAGRALGTHWTRVVEWMGIFGWAAVGLVALFGAIWWIIGAVQSRRRRRDGSG